MRRAILWGAVAAIVVGAIVVASLAVVLKPSDDEILLSRVLVIASAPSADGGDIAPVAFILDDDGSATVVDMLEPLNVAGSSADNASEAFPFGGGSVVARALSARYGGRNLEWVVIPPDTWAAIIDEAGGVEVSIPSPLSVYAQGQLTVLEGGRQTLTGQEAVALVSAIDYLKNASDRKLVTMVVARSLGSSLAAKQPAIDTLVRDGRAQSSVEPNLLPVRRSSESTE